jgi:Ca2+-binding EF-hand superfamily protein
MFVLVTQRAFALGLGFFLCACASGMDQQAAAPQGSGSSANPACENLMQFSRITFAAADQNRDGVIDEAEFASDVAAAFAGQDANHDEKLTQSELAGAPPGTFERLNTSHTGALTFKEVRQAKLAEFQRADTNGDGVLSWSEVEQYNARQGGC